MTIFSSDAERRAVLIRRWYRDYLHHHIQTQAILDSWRDYMVANGVEATWVAIVESAEGDVRLAQAAHADGLADVVDALKVELDTAIQPGTPLANTDAIQAQIDALSKHLGVGTA